MSDFYLIHPNCSAGMQDTKTMDGMYIANRILPVGSIVPLEWKGRQRVRDLYLPAEQLIEYTPLAEDMEIIYLLWPSIRPNGYKAKLVPNNRIGSPEKWTSGWYEIQAPDKRRNMSSIPYGVSALCDIAGVCKAGDVALVGDIVPAAFFAGLSIEQFDRLETIGLCSESWLSSFSVEWRGAYLRDLARPVIQRVAISEEKRQALYEKYPAMNPNAIQETIVKTVKRKG